MSYATIEKQIKAVPAEYLDEIADYIDYVLFKANNRKKANSNNTSKYFGCITEPIDGLTAQRGMRDEWD